MILGFMQKFPWGEETYFKYKILGVYAQEAPRKIHTIRASEKRRWKEGQAVQMATGVRTKFYDQFNKDIPELQTIKGVQRIDIILRGENCILIFIDRKLFFRRLDYDVSLRSTFNYGGFCTFLQNDGITEEQFFKFFTKSLRNGQILHFTDLKY